MDFCEFWEVNVVDFDVVGVGIVIFVVVVVGVVIGNNRIRNAVSGCWC